MRQKYENKNRINEIYHVSSFCVEEIIVRISFYFWEAEVDVAMF